jgi:molecular chaperone DnaK (HSP70)
MGTEYKELFREMDAIEHSGKSFITNKILGMKYEDLMKVKSILDNTPLRRDVEVIMNNIGGHFCDSIKMLSTRIKLDTMALTMVQKQLSIAYLDNFAHEDMKKVQHNLFFQEVYKVAEQKTLIKNKTDVISQYEAEKKQMEEEEEKKRKKIEAEEIKAAKAASRMTEEEKNTIEEEDKKKKAMEDDETMSTD